MAGFENTDRSGKTYANIVDGKFAIRATEKTVGAVKRTNKTGKEVWELLYDTLSGAIITKIEKTESQDFGFSWEVTLKVGIDKVVLNLPYSGRATNGLFHRLPNIDLSAPITLNIFKIENDQKPGTYRTFLTVTQKGEKVLPAYTKDAPNGLPQLEQITVKGKLQWDDSKQMVFIEAMLNEKIIPALEKLNGAPGAQPGEPEVEGPDLDDLDMPF